jgi:hypothetical protein
MKQKIKTIIAGFICASVLLTAQPVFAQGFVFCGTRAEDVATTPELEGECKFSDLFELVYRIVNYLIAMAGFVAIFFVVWGGVRMLLSAGNTSAIQEAKSTIWHAILGLILTLLVYLIVGYVAGLVFEGVDDPLRFMGEFLRT